MGLRKDGPRPAVVGTCTLRQSVAVDADDQLRQNLAMIDQMVAQAADKGWRLDLAVLPECSFQFAEGDVRRMAQTLDGPIVTAVAKKAKQHGCYATAPTQTLRDGRVYNSLVLVGRQGEVIGVYDKAFPVLMGDGTLEYGITPGRRFPVFDLDFGRVGMQICWDIAFAPGWQALADQDAELVLFSTNPAVPIAMRGHAFRHGYYVVAATVHPPALIVDPIGRIVQESTQERESLVARLDLDYRVLHSNCMWEWSEERARPYKDRLRIEWDRDAHCYLATSEDPTLCLREFLEQEHLLTGRQRNARNIRLQDEARGGPLELPEPVVRD
jgi:predicted amidohydrolase